MIMILIFVPFKTFISPKVLTNEYASKGAAAVAFRYHGNGEGDVSLGWVCAIEIPRISPNENSPSTW